MVLRNLYCKSFGGKPRRPRSARKLSNSMFHVISFLSFTVSSAYLSSSGSSTVDALTATNTSAFSANSDESGGVSPVIENETASASMNEFFCFSRRCPRVTPSLASSADLNSL